MYINDIINGCTYYVLKVKFSGIYQFTYNKHCNDVN